MDKNKTIVVAITGSIGSGKSTAVNWFKKKGIEVHSADLIGHQAFKDNDIKNEIISTFGENILTDDEIDRHKLGNIVFADHEKLNQLNSIMHPYIIDKMKKIIASLKHKRLIVFEVPLLFETDIDYLFDVIINIHCPQDIRIGRVSNRDDLDKNQIKARIDKQMSDEIKKQRATVTIDNDCSLESLYNKLEAFLARYS